MALVGHEKFSPLGCFGKPRVVSVHTSAKIGGSFDPTLFQIIEVDKKGIVTNFYEKIKNPPGSLANGAVYAFDNDFLYWLINEFLGSAVFSTFSIPKRYPRYSLLLSLFTSLSIRFNPLFAAFSAICL